jgi:hypothetical protein
MSGPSEKADEYARAHWANPDVKNIASISVRKAHDPALGLDRSVCARDFLRDVVEALREDERGWEFADFIEFKFGGSA